MTVCTFFQLVGYRPVVRHVFVTCRIWVASAGPPALITLLVIPSGPGALSGWRFLITQASSASVKGVRAWVGGGIGVTSCKLHRMVGALVP